MVPAESFVDLETSSTLKRSSMSIFSRRGHDNMPEPSLKSRPSTTRSTSTTSLPKTKLWRRSKDASSMHGTILRAVPKAYNPPPMTTLERAMATSPNDEILKSIAETTTPIADVTAFDAPPLPPQPRHSIVASSSASIKTTKSKKEKSPKSPKPAEGEVIGVWLDGEVRWDNHQKNGGVSLVSSITEAFKSAELDKDLPERPKTSGEEQKKKPRISVIIPSIARKPFHPMGMFRSEVSVVSRSSTVISKDDLSPGVASMDSQLLRSIIISPLHLNASLPATPGEAKKPELLRGDSEDSTHRSTASNSSNSGEDDAMSDYSKRTSMTSIDIEAAPAAQRLSMNLHNRTGSQVFSIKSPAIAGVFAEPNPPMLQPLQLETVIPPSPLDLKPLPPPPVEDSLESEIQHAMWNSKPKETVQYPGSLSPDIVPCKRLFRHSAPAPLLTSNLDQLDSEFNRSNPNFFESTSPTLSQAEQDLTNQLSTIHEGSPVKADPEAVALPLSPAKEALPPLPPRKSSKRVTRGSALQMTVASRAANGEITIRKGAVSVRLSQRSKSLRVPRTEAKKKADRKIAAEQAEAVLLHIMEKLESLEDLFNAAVINKGFYRVYKRRELHLIRTVVWNSSAAAWEHREICHPGAGSDGDDTAAPKKEYTAKSYLRAHQEDLYTIASVRSLIVERCRSLLRAETIAALESNDPAQSAHLDDAFWRIWTFCSIFGSGKGREDDIVAQMDWLRGGPLAHQKTCTASILTSDPVELSSVLMHAPDCFAKGNGKGLTAEQLYDMTEIWTCLSVLVQGLQGRAAEAKQWGIFEGAELEGGDVNGEESMLEEYQAYLMTLGLPSVLTVASHTTSPSSPIFPTLKAKALTSWTPPTLGNSRATFLREPLSKLYEERLSELFPVNGISPPTASGPTVTDMADLRQRQAMSERAHEHRLGLAHDLIARKRQGNWPLSHERPMSEYTLRSGISTSPATTEQQALRLRDAVSCAMNVQTVGGSSAGIGMGVPASRSRPVSSYSFAEAEAQRLEQQRLRDAVSASNHTIGYRKPVPTGSVPIIRVPTPPQRNTTPPTVPGHRPMTSSEARPMVLEKQFEKALMQVVEMGFTPEDARRALLAAGERAKGDGLRGREVDWVGSGVVERAVEGLLAESF